MMTSETDELVARLQEGAFFGRWPAAEVAALVERCALETLHVGEPLWIQGETSQRAFVLVRGRIERTQRSWPNIHRTEQFSEPGALMSISSMVSAWAHTSAAYPLEPSEVLILDHSAFTSLMEASHPAAFRLVDAIAENLVHEMRDVNRRLQEVFGHPAETLRSLQRRMRDQ
jgi:CRP/FNR family transcriptional regulator, cyclic AMP receptor protein